MKKIFLFLLLCVVYVSPGMAYTLSGKVLDAKTAAALDFVDVVLYRPDSETPLMGAMTDGTGAFVLSPVEDGGYVLRVSFMGYARVERPVRVSGTDVDCGAIRLAEEDNLLQEVEVVGQGSQMRFEIDRKVFSVDQNIASAGGSATEVLENIPSVEVDQEGNISLRNSEAVEVWINGKPSGLTADNRAQILQQMPAENIESIEVITNPSAKFNPEGTAGVINLVLKKDRKAGYYGSVSGGLMYPDGARLGGNAGASINYSSSRVDAYANIGYRNMGRAGGSVSDLLNYNAPDTLSLHQDNRNTSAHNGLFFRAGADWHVDDRNTLGVSGFGMLGGGGDEATVDYLYQNLTLGDTLRRYDRLNTSDSRHNGMNVNVDYRHEFDKKGTELLASASYSRHHRANSKDYLQTDYYPSAQQTLVHQEDGGTDQNVQVKVDYTNKLTETGRLEAGLQTDLSWRGSTSDGEDEAGVRLDDYYNLFDYQEQIYALYVTYGERFWDKFSAQLGLRGEYMHRTLYSAGVSGEVELGDYRQSYMQLFPSVYLGYSITKRDEIQLNYTRRVNRPRGWQINPFRDYSDSTVISFGNPALNPEFASAFELNYMRSWDNHSLSASAYYRFTDDVIQRVRYRTDVNMESTFMNVSRSDYAGLELIAKNRLFKILNLTTSVNLYYSSMDSAVYTNPYNGISERISAQQGFSWDARVMGNFMFSPTFSGQVTARYRSPRVIAQGRQNGNYSIDLGLRKSFCSRALNVSVNVRDLLNSRRRSTTTAGNGFLQTSESYWSGRTIGLTLAYNFGNMQPKRDTRKTATPIGMDGAGEEEY